MHGLSSTLLNADGSATLCVSTCRSAQLTAVLTDRSLSVWSDGGPTCLLLGSRRLRDEAGHSQRRASVAWRADGRVLAVGVEGSRAIDCYKLEDSPDLPRHLHMRAIV